MACDFFSSLDAKFLLENRTILFLGDSNSRALYKDLVWLVHHGQLIPQSRLCKKNEESHANDKKLSDGKLTRGRNYVEIREYSENNLLLRFEFITQLNPARVTSLMSSFRTKVDAIVINSCVWDFSRWGPNQVPLYKNRIERICKYILDCHPQTRLIWLATLPVSYNITHGFLAPEVIGIRKLLPWHILEANNYTRQCCRQFKHDFIDLHYHTRGILLHRSKDGIHWKPEVTRYIANMFLTHLAFCWGTELPGNWPLDRCFVDRSTRLLQSKQIQKKPPVSRTLPNKQRPPKGYRWTGPPKQNDLCTLPKKTNRNRTRRHKRAKPYYQCSNRRVNF